MTITSRAYAAAAFCFVVFSFCACGDSDKIKKVTLRASPDSAESAPGAGTAASASLRISVASILSPSSSFVTYGELEQYLGKRLKMPVKLSFTKNYSEANYSLRNSEADLAFICTGGYLTARETVRLTVLAVPVVDGKTVYNSLIVARKDAPERSLGELKGKVFAFSDESSLTGRLYVLSRLADEKLTSVFFSETIFTGSHDNSIRAVAEKLADAACINSLVYRALLGRGDSYAKKLKVIEASPAFGNPPVVVREGLPAGLRDRLRAVFLEMHKDPEGRRLLRTMAVERFVTPPPGLYSSAEKLYVKVPSRVPVRK